jgi:hypothetical protein
MVTIVYDILDFRGELILKTIDVDTSVEQESLDGSMRYQHR